MVSGIVKNGLRKRRRLACGVERRTSRRLVELRHSGEKVGEMPSKGQKRSEPGAKDSPPALRSRPVLSCPHDAGPTDAERIVEFLVDPIDEQLIEGRKHGDQSLPLGLEGSL